MDKITIRKATKSDISFMVELSKTKRLAYEKAQPQFWKYSEGAELVQRKWFAELIYSRDHIALVAASHGFVIGRLTKPPKVYNPGGLTLIIDDFCVLSQDLWQSVGAALITELKSLAKEKSATQILVVSGHHDDAKRELLQKLGLKIASEWHVASID